MSDDWSDDENEENTVPIPSLLLTLPVQLVHGGGGTEKYPVQAGIRILDTSIDGFLVQFYEGDKESVLLMEMGMGKGREVEKNTSMEIMEEGGMVLLGSKHEVWKVKFRSKEDGCKFATMFCGCLAVVNKGIVKLDFVKPDKKAKQCRAEHYAIIKYQLCSFSESSLSELKLQFELNSGGITTEIKITEKFDDQGNGVISPGSFAELLSTLKCGAKKLIASPFNLTWARELGEKIDESFFVILVELVSVSKKSKLRRLLLQMDSVM